MLPDRRSAGGRAGWEPELELTLEPRCSCHLPLVEGSRSGVTASWIGAGVARGFCPRRIAPAKGMKKAEGPIWPTAQSLVRAGLPPGLALGGRRSPARGRIAAHASGSSRCLGEIAHETPRDAAAFLADLREFTGLAG